ncbi:MAG: polysaccharide biosynthesis tyrosine autokinase [Phycisphaeraceae bacterium]
MRILREHLKLLVFTAVVGLVLGVATWVLLRLTHAVYRSEAQLVVIQAVTNTFDTPLFGVQHERMENTEAFMANVAYRLTSDEVISEALKQKAVQATAWYKSFNSPFKASEDLKDRLRASAIPDSTLIRIWMRDTHRKDLPIIIDEVTQVYLKKNRIENDRLKTDFRGLLLRERTEAEDEYERLVEQIKQFLAKNDLPSINLAQTDTARAYTQAGEDHAMLAAQVEAARGMYASLVEAERRGKITFTPYEVAEVKATNPFVHQREEELRDLNEFRLINIEKYGPKHQTVTDITLRINELERQTERLIEQSLRESAQARIEQTRQAVELLEGQLVATEERLAETRHRMSDLTGKLTELERLQELAENSTIRRDEANVRLRDIALLAQRIDSIPVRLQEPATIPELVFPTIELVVPGVTFMLLAVVGGTIFLREVLDQRVKSPADVKLLPDAVLLGVLPDAAEDPSGPARIEQTVIKDPAGLMAESFRQVRTALMTRMDRRGYKTLLLTGAKSRCGVTTVVGNLATSLTYNGRKLLVIDANFRRPGQHNFFSVADRPGLADVLCGDVSIDQAIVRVDDPGLDLLPAGHAATAPPEVFDGPVFRNMLASFESRYDLVLIDAPPALLTSDSQLLAKQVDAMVFVIRAMSEKRGMIERMFRRLDGQRADMLGLILNGVRSSAGGYFRKSYKEFYEYRKNDKTDRRQRAATVSAATSEV